MCAPTRDVRVSGDRGLPAHCLSAVVVNTNVRHGNRGITTTARAGVLRDFLKTMSPRARLDGIPVMPALGIDNRGQPPCTIHGKRSGVSESLGRAARKDAGWRELETLHELRAALPTGAEARKERQRDKQRRYRERKRDATAPMPEPTPSKPAWIALADDLSDDFWATVANRLEKAATARCGTCFHIAVQKVVRRR